MPISVHRRVWAQTKKEAERVGKYMIRPLLSLERLFLDERTGKVCFRYGQEAKDLERMEDLEFIARQAQPRTKLLYLNVVQTESGPAFRVPAGHYFCLGDNRFISVDLRIWGPLPADHIIGKPWRNYWSFDKTKEASPDAGIIGWLKDVPRRFIARTRWDRILKRF